MAERDYLIATLDSMLDMAAPEWDDLLLKQSEPTPFMRHAYLSAMETSGSAVPGSGWTTQVLTLRARPSSTDDPVGLPAHGELLAACVVYIKTHSYGEYIFDHAWAQAYRQHGLAYYPKALVAPPFTPVPGARLLARDAQARRALVRALVDWCVERSLSSLHVLFLSPDDLAACQAEGLLERHNLQFHWTNRSDGTGGPWSSFEDFLASLTQEKRKKIRQERRKVADAGVTFEALEGRAIMPAHWDFFYRCYERTYLEHGNPPYLTRAFFEQLALSMPEAWLLFVAHRGGRAIACSLIALNHSSADAPAGIAYGRYWGALERVDCLHFEACYYQPLQWCIARRFQRFEGGAQGEHKLARALMPVPTRSAHWLAHPAFADAVDRFLQRERPGIDSYLHELEAHSPFRTPAETGPG